MLMRPMNRSSKVRRQLIAALKRAYAATESKLEETSTPGSYQAVNDRMMSQSDPDAAMVRKGSGDSRFALSTSSNRR
jgi:hypothetical protein